MALKRHTLTGNPLISSESSLATLPWKTFLPHTIVVGHPILLLCEIVLTETRFFKMGEHDVLLYEIDDNSIQHFMSATHKLS